MLQPTERKFFHALLSTGAEHDALLKLRSAFPNYETMWRASSSSLAAAGLSEERVGAISSARKHWNPDAELRKLVTAGISLLAYEDPEYPPILATIAQPPFGLYIKGRFRPERARLAVVGTRKTSRYGLEATRKIVADLIARADVDIVSGLAQGIDGAAHRAALDAGASTIGVLGSGTDQSVFFPSEHWNLAEDMVRRDGAVISEYPPNTPASRYRFPARNSSPEWKTFSMSSISQGARLQSQPSKTAYPTGRKQEYSRFSASR